MSRCPKSEISWLRSSFHIPGRVGRVGTAVVSAVVAGCSFAGGSGAAAEPCDPADRTVVMESTTLANAEPSGTFDISPDRNVFVTMLADPSFNEGAGLNGGLVHASVYVISDGEDPHPASSTGTGEFQPSPGFRLPSAELPQRW